MSHLICPKCKSNNHTTGYGLAAGPFGGYTYCDDCETLIDFVPDLDGVSDEEAERIKANVAKWRKETWGDA